MDKLDNRLAFIKSLPAPHQRKAFRRSFSMALVTQARRDGESNKSDRVTDLSYASGQGATALYGVQPVSKAHVSRVTTGHSAQHVTKFGNALNGNCSAKPYDAIAGEPRRAQDATISHLLRKRNWKALAP